MGTSIGFPEPGSDDWNELLKPKPPPVVDITDEAVAVLAALKGSDLKLAIAKCVGELTKSVTALTERVAILEDAVKP